MPGYAVAKRSRSEETLARIADIVGCPVEVFEDGVVLDGPVGDTAELLRLWLAIEQADDRRSVLDLTRSLAKECALAATVPSDGRAAGGS